MLTLNGSHGEGGGQVLRTSLALSALTQTPFRIEKIRAKRSRPGLLRQHLTAVRAMAEVCSARLHGDELGSSTLVFEPGKVRHGDYRFSVGTAGSATLVFQTVLFPLLFSEGKSSIVFEGGTHNAWAPPLDFIVRTFLPLLHRMGANVNIEAERHGFYPAGGGRFRAALSGVPRLEPLRLLSRGNVERVELRALSSHLPPHVAARELAALSSQLADLPCVTSTEDVQSPGPGNVALVHVRTKELVETFSGFGERGVRAETIASRLAAEVRRYVSSDAVVGEHLADQLLLPLALSNGGAFLTGTPSLHTKTNLEIIEKFLPDRLSVNHEGALWLVANKASEPASRSTRPSPSARSS